MIGSDILKNSSKVTLTDEFRWIEDWDLDSFPKYPL